MITRKKIFNAALLIAGTTIGAGMLALPIVTASCGFFPSVLLFLVCYLFMMATGLLLVEALLWFKGELNLISLSSVLLGPLGKWCSWILYLFLFYTLSVAYVAGGADLLEGWIPLAKPLIQGLFVASLAFFVMKGTKTVQAFNRYLMVGLFLAYGALMLTGWSKVQFSWLGQVHFDKIFLGLPVVFTSFSYQGIIPSLKTYLEGNVKALRQAVCLGVSIPFIFYVIWQAFIIGLVPVEDLSEAQRLGRSAIFPLQKQLGAPWIFYFGQLFAFFAITTSFLGVTLGLKDFLKDGLKLKGHQTLLTCLTFLPPLLIAQGSLNIFITALGFAGGIGCALLLGFMPLAMVYKGVYKLHHKPLVSAFLTSKPVLITLAIFVIAEVLLEIKILIG